MGESIWVGLFYSAVATIVLVSIALLAGHCKREAESKYYEWKRNREAAREIPQADPNNPYQGEIIYVPVSCV
jgi:hypothetical protein